MTDQKALIMDGAYLIHASIADVTPVPPDQLTQYAEWFRAGCYTYTNKIEITDHLSQETAALPTSWRIRQSRKADGHHYGESRIWLITDQEAEAILSEDRDRKAMREAARKADRDPEPARGHGRGYCHSCQTYCYGDCGHYAPSPNTHTTRRDMREMCDQQATDY